MAKDFGDILTQWEAKTAKPFGKKRIAKLKTVKSKENQAIKPKAKTSSIKQKQEAWLQKYGVIDKDAEAKYSQKQKNFVRPEKIKIDDKIDLHGMTEKEAESALHSFFMQALSKGFKKVLIIHGKGNHSKDEPVLKKLVQRFIEKNPNAGRSGRAKAENGGSGATWVILK
ncbi:MAG: Smr/MutS family protein [Treponemataceae bacterium]